jgi:hypothetical protein
MTPGRLHANHMVSLYRTNSRPYVELVDRLSIDDVLTLQNYYI